MDDNQRIDFWLLALTLILAGMGLVMVYSSSMYLSIDKIGSGSYYFKRQTMHLVIGLLVMMFLTRVNYRGFANIGTALLIVGYVMLCALLIQNQIKGIWVNRWLRVGRIAFQPSEIMKVILIIFLAGTISNMGEKVRDFKRGFLPLLGIILLTFVLVFLEPHLGISVLLLISGLYILFVGRAKLIHMIMILVPVFSSIILLVTRVPYMKKRWEEFISPEMAYQIKQSIISIGSGGLFGVGLGNSTQKYYFLPELHTDFVFSILAEEIGLIGAGILMLLTLMYVLRGFKIARQAPDMFGFLLASGFSFMMAIQVFVNIGVAIRLLPTTGMTLPFISYGGSSLVTYFIATGILLNISKQGNFEMRLSRELGARRYRRVFT
ncbi:MAG TPA: cell division protein FtsW [bacterium]|nr:cell division protein FtsW [bacterium]